MFLTDCHTCGLRELRGTRSIEILVNTEAGPELVYRCTRCATLNVLDGARRPQPVREPAEPVPAAVAA
jgi:hypothetical protein